jgi:chaperonin GroES
MTMNSIDLIELHGFGPRERVFQSAEPADTIWRTHLDSPDEQSYSTGTLDLRVLDRLFNPFLINVLPQWRKARMKVKPLHDRILVKRVEQKEQRAGNIIIPDSAKEKPMEGKVIAVGSGKVEKDGKRTPLEVKVGDRILFGKYSGTEIKLDDKEHVILREDEILGIVQ